MVWAFWSMGMGPLLYFPSQDDAQAAHPLVGAVAMRGARLLVAARASRWRKNRALVRAGTGRGADHEVVEIRSTQYTVSVFILILSHTQWNNTHIHLM